VPLFIEMYAKPKNRGWKESERLLGKFQPLADQGYDGTAPPGPFEPPTSALDSEFDA
jgi:hypothetical protein